MTTLGLILEIRAVLAKATPWPWIWNNDTRDAGGRRTSTLNGTSYCVALIDAGWRVRNSDAKLISAAPDLLQRAVLALESQQKSIAEQFHALGWKLDSIEAAADELERLSGEARSGAAFRIDAERAAEALESAPKLWTCPDCAFAFDASHKDEATGGYSCPACGERRAAEEIEALRKDAERLDWLAHNGSRVDYDVCFADGDVGDLYRVWPHTADHDNLAKSAPTLRGAIDASMQASIPQRAVQSPASGGEDSTMRKD